jgi:Flp pilus assembly protein TadB
MNTNTQEPKLPRRTTWLIALIVWGAALLVAVVISYLSNLNIWICLGVVVAAWVVNGIIAEIEDRLPGGFLNPRRGPDKGSGSQ